MACLGENIPSYYTSTSERPFLELILQCKREGGLKKRDVSRARTSVKDPFFAKQQCSRRSRISAERRESRAEQSEREREKGLWEANRNFGSTAILWTPI